MMDDPIILRSQLEQEQNLVRLLEQRNDMLRVECDALRSEIRRLRQQCDTEVLHKRS
jgi:hypothetical protein